MFEVCPPDDEVCDNGLDDDGDGQVDCFDPDCACAPAPCAYSDGDDVGLNVSGGSSDPAYTTVYVLLDAVGNIVQLAAEPDRAFENVGVGVYYAYALNYEAASGVSNLGVGNSIANVGGACLDWSAPYAFEVCGGISGIAFKDCNNGLQEPFEGILADVPVSLLDDQGNVVANTSTASDGTYNFEISGLVDGSYQIEFGFPTSPSGLAYTIKDANGNANDGIDSDVDQTTGRTDFFTYNGEPLANISAGYEDTENPVLAGVPSDVTVDCNQIPATPSVSVTDNCDNEVDIVYSETVGNGCPYTITRTWTATDDCGNSTTVSQSITVNDTDGPVLAGVPNDTNVGCNDPVPVVPTVTATDNCDGDVVVAFSETSSGSECSSTITRTWTATDDCGNMTSASQAIEFVDDTEGPVLVGVPDDTNVGCDGTVPVVPTVTATDNCDDDVVVNFSEASSGSGCSSIITRTWTATDDCGNMTSVSQVINVGDDSEDPVLVGVPNDITVDCGQVPALPTVTAIDDCDTDVDIVYSEMVGNGCPYTITRTWTATDNCGNSTAVSQSITVNDTDGPVLAGVPNDTNVGCNDPVPVVPTVTANDNCDDSVAVAFSETSNGSGCNSVLTRTWTATDACGNTVSASQVIQVGNDGESPVLVGVPSDVTVDCEQIPAPPMVTATDGCDDDVDIVYAETVGGGCPYTITRTWTATDDCGNSTSEEQAVTVVDSTAPVLTPNHPDLIGAVHGDTLAFECENAPSFKPWHILAADNCDPDPAVITIELMVEQTDCIQADFFRLMQCGWEVVDECGNSSEFYVYIKLIDTKAPVLVDIPNDITLDCGEPLPNEPPLTAYDNCGGNIDISFSETSEEDGCLQIVTRTWTATDGCGNTTNASQIISVINDSEPPVLVGVPTDVTIDCGGTAPPVPTISATDNCDSDIIITYTETAEAGSCAYLIFRTWTATDGCGNTTTAVQTIQIGNDSVLPLLVGVPANIYVDCGGTAPPLATVTAVDNCDNNLEVMFSETSSGTTCAEVLTRTWMTTDGCGNMATATQIISIGSDTEPPVLVGVPTDTNVGCGETVPPLPTVTATDNCDGTVAVVYTETTGGASCSQVLTRTWTATDGCGNVATATQVINIGSDTEPPVLVGVPTDTNVGCGETVPPLPTVTATDNCDGTVAVVYTETTGGASCSQVLTRTWTATDGCGNVATATQVIDIGSDTEPPVLVGVPSDTTVGCDYIIPPGLSVTATDNCEDDLEVTYSETITGTACAEVLTRTWTATDNCGNTATGSQSITIIDEESPIITVNVPYNDGDTLYLECDEVLSLSEDDATVTDNCCADPDIEFQEFVTAGNCAIDDYLQVMTCRWMATDCCGNTSIFSFTIFVIDETPPQLVNVPSDMTLDCADATPNPPTVIAMDNCDNDVNVTMTVSSVPDSCGDLVTRTWTAIDDCGNTNSASQTIYFTDEELPVIVGIPDDITVECEWVEMVTSPITVTDNCTVNPQLTYTTEVVQIPCGEQIIRTWTATDDCGNIATETQVITATDTEAPVLVGVPTNTDVGCGEPFPTIPTVTATDNCDGVVDVVFTETTSGSSCAQMVTRTWTATDSCGNTATASQVINVGYDFVAPILIGVPTETYVGCGEPVPPIPTVTATDNCDTNVVVTYTETVDGSTCAQVIIRTWTATDDCGNIATASQEINIGDDVEPPVLSSLPAHVKVNCGEIPAPTPVTATDNCDDDVTITYSEAVDGQGCFQVITRTWIATDDCGNSTTGIQVITIIDEILPVFVGVPMDTYIGCGEPVPPVPTVTATDNCDDDVGVSFSETIDGTACGQEVVRTWTAIDDCGNVATATQVINVGNDSEPPVLVGVPTDIYIDCGENVPPIPTVTATDNCDGAVDVTYSETTTGTSCAEVLTRTWTATDGCGNTATATQVINIGSDTEPPVLGGVPADATLSCAELPAPPIVKATDNCDGDVVVTLTETVNGSGCSYNVTRTWTATDDCGNTTTGVQVITVNDTEGPEITFTHPWLVGLTDGDTLVMECDSTETFSEADAQATDGCGAVDSIAFIEDFVTVGDCPEDGFIVIMHCTWIAEDACGNQTSVTIHMRIEDNHPPIITGVPDDVTVSCGDPLPDCTMPNVADACGTVALGSSTENVTTPEGYNIVCTWTATDQCGNQAVAQQVIIVIDNLNVTVVETQPACESNSGSASLSPLGIGYVWSDGGTGANRSDLAVGTYTVTATSGNCSTTIAVDIEEDCPGCPEDIFDIEFLEETIFGTEGQVCLPLPYVTSLGYDIYVDGDLYEPDLEPCDNQDLILYTYSLVYDQGNSGPYTVEWEDTAGSPIMDTVVDDMDGLVAAMNVADPPGMWERDQSLLGFTSTNINGDYGDMNIVHDLTQAVSTVQLNTLTVPMGTAIVLEEGIHEVVYVNPGTGCSDTVTVSVVSASPSGDILGTRMTAVSADCGDGNLDICLEIPFNLKEGYSFELNGTPYSGGFGACDHFFDHYYAYAILPGMGFAGPFTLDEWTVNGQGHSAVFNTMEELVGLMNIWDATGDWALDGTTFTLRGGSANSSYGTMKVTQPGSGISTMLEVNTNISPGLTNIQLSSGENELVITRLADGITDTLTVMAACVTTTYFSDVVSVGETGTVSLETDELMGEVTEVKKISTVGADEAAQIGQSVESTTVPYSGMHVGSSDACYVICDEHGICDTTFISIEVRSESITDLTTPDTLTTVQEHSVKGDVLLNDEIRNDVVSLEIVKSPNHGSVTVDPDHTVVYHPEKDYCNNSEYGSLDHFFYEACTDNGCYTEVVWVEVLCGDLVVNTGFSPNGDGINDFFRIEGLERYPDHRLVVFNRWGSKVFSSKNYQNDWDGSWDNSILPDGTYFYILEYGDGRKHTGFIQIRR